MHNPKQNNESHLPLLLPLGANSFSPSRSSGSTPETFCVLVEDATEDIRVPGDTHTGKMPCGLEGRDQNNVSTSQGMPKIASNLPSINTELYNKVLTHEPERWLNR